MILAFLLASCAHPVVRAPDPAAAATNATNATNATPAYVGTDACASCHPSQVEKWRSTKHATAYDTLVRVESAHNPSCLACHVVGLGDRSGWTGAADIALAGVGCESCHGAASVHVAAPNKPSLARATAATCARCHTADTSPDFDFSARWPVIRHPR